MLKFKICKYCGCEFYPMEDEQEFCCKVHAELYKKEAKRSKNKSDGQTKKKRKSAAVPMRDLTEHEQEICKTLRLSSGKIDTIREGRATLDWYIKLDGWKYGIC